MIRSLLLFLSRRKGLRRWMETSSLVRPLTSRFVAGLTLDDALRVCARLQRDGVLITLDRLGENVASLDEAAASRNGYLEALAKIAELGFPASVSIKPTQFGLDLSEVACHENIGRLVEQARRLGRMIEIDMESSDYVDRTMRIVIDLHSRYGNVRGVIQAYLYRSAKDVDRYCDLGVPVRLCKGAYRESAAVAFQRKREVDSSYVRLMRTLLERGKDPAIATHDERIIAETQKYAAERGLAPEQFEFQMLYGVRRDLERRFLQQNCRLRLYVPFGQAWYPYFMRRLAERPANLFFLLKNLVRG